MQPLKLNYTEWSFIFDTNSRLSYEMKAVHENRQVYLGTIGITYIYE